MENKSSQTEVGIQPFVCFILLMLITSILPDIIIKEWTGSIPVWLNYAKLAILLGTAITSYYIKSIRGLLKYSIVLSVIIVMQMLTNYIVNLHWWDSFINEKTFAGNFGGSVALKVMAVIPLTVLLITFFKSPREAYLSKGDLSAKAQDISWLGLKRDSISWGRLSVISGVLISLGTVLLTVFTVTGLSSAIKTSRLLAYFPLIILFALINSFCEGIVFRSAVLASLKDHLTKNQAILISAAFFGIAHYYGAPRGIVGVIMSGVLGWYMVTSVYETKGFAASWIIHFMQDVVIFSTIVVLGGF